MRQKFLLKTMLLLLSLIVGNSVWATTTFKLTQVTSVEAGGLYVFEQSGHVMNNTVSSSALQTTTSYSSTGLSGTEKYVWKLEAATGGFYLKNVSLSKDSYLNNASSTNVSFGDKSSIWTFTFTDGIALISNKSNSDRFLGYTNSTSYAYKAYAASNLSSYDHAITVYKLEEEGNLTNSDLALADAPVELSFDLFNNSSAQVVAFTTSSTGAVTVSESEYIDCVVNANTITVTPLKVTPSAQTITISQAADDTYRAGSATFTVSIDDSTPIPTHTVTFSVNGTATTQDFEEGAAITFPTNPADVEGKTFVGWTESAITGVIDDAPTFVTSATMGTEALTFYAVFADKTPGTQTTVTDVLTSALTGVTGTGNYSDWSDITVTSKAVYAGNSAKNTVNAIQMRSNNSNSGIISTTSGGTLKSVTVTWTDANTSGRSLDIYGSNTAYSAATDLYDSKKQGTKLGSITYDTSTSLTISGDYTYVGLRSNNGALYLADISIEWIAGTPDTYSAYCTTVAVDNRQEAGISFAEATVTKEIVDNYTGQTLTNPNNVSPITWTSSNEAVATVEDGTVTVLAVGETTIKASFAGDEAYKKAEVSYTLTVQDSRQAIDLSFAETSVNVNITETVDAPTLNGNTGNGAVTYESSNTDIATVDVSGVVTGVAVGTATITATVAATNEYLGGTATFTVKVVNPNANDGSSIEKAFTVAEAIDVIKALPNNDATTEKYYIKGIVSSFQKTSIVGDGTNYRYFISDDGKTTTELQVFKGKGLNEATFTDADDLLVGDEVVIYGPIQYYQGKTPEIAEGNYLVSWNRPADTTPSITVDPDLVDVDANEHDGTLGLDYANLTITKVSDFGVQYYDAEGEETSEPEWIEVTVAEQDPQIGEGYVVSYYMLENKDDARTAYFKVYAMDDETNLVYSNVVTITQAAPVAGDEYALFTGDLVEGDYVIYYDGYAMKNTVDNSRLSYEEVSPANDVITTDNAAIVWHIAKSGDYWTIYSANANAYAASTGAKNKAQMLADGTDDKALWEVSGNGEYEFVNKANGDADVNAYLRNNGEYGFACYAASTGGDLSLYKKVNIEVESITISDAGYATYCSEKDLYISGAEGLTAYKATISTDNKVTFTPVTVIPALDGVLLKGEKGQYNVPVIESSLVSIEDNVFEGVITATEEPAGIFVLMKGDWEGGKGVGFYKTTQPFTVGANTAYLPADVAGARTFIGFDFNDATAIDGIAAETMANGEVYNLQGQRVVAPQKGLYIVNGKKVLVK